MSLLKYLALTFCLAAFCVPVLSEAKTLYVDSAIGNDSTTYAANNASNPWRTLGRAAWGSTDREARVSAQAAQAGDVVLVSAGTYSTAGSNTRNEPAFYSQNAGTIGNPVTYRAVGTVSLVYTSGAGPIIGCYYQNYVTWDGFTIDESLAPSRPDTGPVTSWGSTGCVFQNLTILGNGNSNSANDNHAGIRIEQTVGTVIRNNRIQNIFTTGNTFNGACVKTYSSEGFIIENNDFSQCGAGVFVKGGPFSSALTHRSVIRYNYFHNIGKANVQQGGCIGLHAGAPYNAANPIVIHQNFFGNCQEAAVRVWNFDGTNVLNNPAHAKIVNNTSVGSQNTIWVSNGLIANAGIVVWNNIMVNNSSFATAANVLNTELQNPAYYDSEHNLFFGYGQFAASASGNFSSLATWQSTLNQDAAAPASQVADPRFVGGTDYHLQTSSPARTLGVDYLDLDGDGSTTDIIPAGMYVTGNETIGLTSGGTPPGDSTPPAAAPSGGTPP